MNTVEEALDNPFLWEDPEEEDEQASEEGNALYEHFRLVVDRGQNPLRIDRFLVDKLASVSRNKIQEASAAGCVFVNDSVVKSNYKVKPGDVISVRLAWPERDLSVVPEDIPLNIVYEDNALLVINKPAGMVVHPAVGHATGTMINALAFYLRDNPLFAGDDPRLGLVHRIDKDTSGLLVVAKTEAARSNLGMQFYRKSSSRLYQALVWGNMEQETGTIIGNIGRDPLNRKVMKCFPPESETGKAAVTHYRVLERFGYVTLVECRLETGRTHQIRAHFKSLRHPLFNDAAYGGDEILKGTTFTKYKQFIQNCFATCPRQALHAKTLGFDHPETGERMEFNSELPSDMAALLDKWRSYSQTQGAEYIDNL